MPGDNAEMVCDLMHDVAAEVGTQYVALLYSSSAFLSQATTGSPYGKVEKQVSSCLVLHEMHLMIILDSRGWYCH